MHRKMLLVAMAFLLLWTGDAYAAPAGSSSIQQQGLTLHELDKELERLKAREAALNEQIPKQQTLVQRHALRLEQQAEQAGNIIRAYYMGHRTKLWMVLLSANSFGDMLTAVDYLKLIIKNDYRILENYKHAYQEQQRLLAELEKQKLELEQTILEYEKQRARRIAEQEELERQLAQLSEEEQAKELQQMAALTELWETEGLPAMESALNALSDAMNRLPELLSDPEMINIEGSQLIVTLTDERWNGFLREQDPLFDTFAFVFAEEGMSVSGEINGLSASIQGNYVIEQEPVHRLSFQIEEVVFNGFALPDTTRSELQEKYALFFEPGLLFDGLTVTHLSMKEGQLRIELAYKLGNSAGGSP